METCDRCLGSGLTRKTNELLNDQRLRHAASHAKCGQCGGTGKVVSNDRCGHGLAKADCHLCREFEPRRPITRWPN